MEFKNAIFDMDGTLIDSMQIWRNVLTDCVEDMYPTSASEIQSINNKPNRQIY